jgi:truncated hemoglobin YjbI
MRDASAATVSERATLSLIRAVSDELVARMAKDLMIGFFFAKVDLVRLAELEYQHAARSLGFEVPYEGRPLEAAHFPRRIFGGQFDRRMVILREVLAKHAVPAEQRDAWLSHAEAQRDRVVVTGAPDCA